MLVKALEPSDFFCAVEGEGVEDSTAGVELIALLESMVGFEV